MLGGTCGLIGVAPVGVEVSLDMQTLLDARTVRGVIEGDCNPDLFIPQLIDLYKQGKFPFDRLIKFYSLEQINEAAEDSEKGKTLKAGSETLSRSYCESWSLVLKTPRLEDSRPRPLWASIARCAWLRCWVFLSPGV